MSPLVQRLEARITALADEETRSEIEAELAAYLARIGQIEEAKSIVRRLRQSYGDGRFARTMIRIMIAEGISLFFEDFDLHSRDRIHRAYLLSSALGAIDLACLGAAWRMSIDFNKCAYSELAEPIRFFANHPEQADDEAAARFSLALADAFLYAGDRKHALVWYERARRKAIDRGDQATIGAIMYNRAVLTLSRLRVEAIRGKVADGEIAFVDAQLRSARNYGYIGEVDSLTHLFDLADARVSMLKGKWVQAYERLCSLRRHGLEFGFDEQDASIDADIALAAFRSGLSFDANVCMESEERKRSIMALGLDDQLACCSATIEVCSGGLDACSQDWIRSIERAAQDRFSREQEELTELLSLAEIELLSKHPLWK